MKLRINKQELLEILQQWNRFMHRKVRLVACGGTAMTLLNVKDSTKDVDFMVPEIGEYDYLISVIKDLGYTNIRGYGWQRPGENFIFDLFQGKAIHTTELLASPLEEGRHSVYEVLNRIEIFILNDYDLISSKMMRGEGVDFDDCLALLKAHEEQIDLDKLRMCFNELVAYDISEDRIKGNMDMLLQRFSGGEHYG
ncbi:MAG TPA: DUF6036 family nucleotidyltransferase [Candidatus Bathyarchaeia archaeon]|nr:DUF6036 family nucleotidyltransferase [Candidatus Bathyarchaeia archaeon]